jgi:hypothetical protein
MRMFAAKSLRPLYGISGGMVDGSGPVARPVELPQSDHRHTYPFYRRRAVSRGQEVRNGHSNPKGGRLANLTTRRKKLNATLDS